MKEFNFNDLICLENDRVRIEPLIAAHAESLNPIIQKDESLMKYSSIPLRDETELQQYIAIALQAKQDRVRYPFAIFDKQAKTYAGSSSYAFISNKDGRLEIGFTWIGYEFQRTGLNKAMKFLMLQYAFENLGFSRVEFRADSRNLQSRNVIEKIGAIFEGELRSYVLKYDGYRSNTVYYSILADEWPGIKKERFGM